MKQVDLSNINYESPREKRVQLHVFLWEQEDQPVSRFYLGTIGSTCFAGWFFYAGGGGVVEDLPVSRFSLGMGGSTYIKFFFWLGFFVIIFMYSYCRYMYIISM